MNLQTESIATFEQSKKVYINSTTIRWIIIVFLAIGVLTINLPVIFTNYYHEITGAPTSSNGIFDLEDTSIGNKKVYLDGEWEFYWKKLIITNPQDFLETHTYISVPGQWSDYDIDGIRLPADGYASYRMILKNYNYDGNVSIYIPDFGSAYKVFVDKQLVSQSGVLSTEKGNIFTVPSANIYRIQLSQYKDHEVVIETATTRFSGVYMTPILQDFDTIMEAKDIRTAIQFVLFGIVIFSFLSLLSTFFISIKRKLYSFWLPLMIFFILIRIILTAEFYSTWQKILFNISYEATNGVMFFATFVVKYLLIFLVEEQCEIEFKIREKLGFLGYYILLYSLYLFVPRNFYNDYLSVLVPMLTYVLDIYLFIKVYRNAEKMNKFSLPIFLGAMLVIVGLTCDSYYINGKIYYNMSLGLMITFMVFALIVAWVYSRRGFDIYDDLVMSSMKLDFANNQMQMQKEYYESLNIQMLEIREIKHDIKHFIGTMTTLVEEDRIDELKAFLSEYRQKVKLDQLPVFCENIIANSIIGFYYLKAKENKISFESRCNIDKQCFISDSDLCIILGNTLENAITACKNIAEHGSRHISIKVDTLKRQWAIKVTNTFNGDIKKKDGYLVSLKQGKSNGFGIKNIEKVLKAYNGRVEIDYNENTFTFMALASNPLYFTE